MKRDIRLAPIPKTRLSFCNVPMMPVRTRAGETRYLCATWGGAMHLFDRHGAEKVIAYPEGAQGSYSFAPAVEDGFAWAAHTGGKITLIDVDEGEYAFVQDVPLKAINWGATITRDGLLVCAASPGDVMVYDTNRREVRRTIAPISPENHYAHNLRTASDDCVVIAIWSPRGELVRLDPRTGEYESAAPDAVRDGGFFPRSLTLLRDDRIAIPRPARVEVFTYPDFTEAPSLAYPETRADDWRTFRDYGDGRLYAWHEDGGPLYRLDDAEQWEVYLERFAPSASHPPSGMFCALPDRRLLGLNLFGELVEYGPRGEATRVAQLDNLGEQRVHSLTPGEGARVFTTTFINMSLQELDYRTGEGRNISPCQKGGGQANDTVWLNGKLWMAGYGGAEIDVYDPSAGGEWPQNPRPVVDIGEEQMRPVGLETDGRHLWCATHARYGKLGGALARIDPEKETCKTWRNLVPGHNSAGLLVDEEGGRVYVGTTTAADCDSAPPAKGPAATYAFDMTQERVAWVSTPREEATAMTVVGLLRGRLMALSRSAKDAAIHLLRPDDGRLLETHEIKLPPRWSEAWPSCEFLVGPDGLLYVASPLDGLFRYDLADGPGEQLIDGPVVKPRARGADLFFVRDYRVGVCEGLWEK